jgi:hypothetical protein
MTRPHRIQVASILEGYYPKQKDLPPTCGYVEAFINGCPNGVARTYEIALDDIEMPIVVRGLGHKNQHILKKAKDDNRQFYYIDTGYMGNNRKTKLYHRIVENNVQNTGAIIERPIDRLNKIKYRAPKARIKGGENILVVPPSGKAMKFYDQDIDEWLEKTINGIKERTDRNIVVRKKPVRHERVVRVNHKWDLTIHEAFNDAWCIVTHNSIAAVEAIMYGKPAIALAPNNAAISICDTSLDSIETPFRPNKEEIMAFAAHLSYCQFTFDEMQSGYAWKILHS